MQFLFGQIFTSRIRQCALCSPLAEHIPQWDLPALVAPIAAAGQDAEL